MLFYKKEVPRYLTLTTDILTLLYLFSLLYFIFEEQTFKIVPCLCSLIITIFIKFTTKKFINIISSIFIFSILIFILFSSYLGSSFNFYALIDNYDDIMHFLSGILSVIFAYNVFLALNTNTNLIFNRNVIILFVFCFNMTIAGLWEIFEFLADNFLGTNMQIGGLSDTMFDMINAFIASLITITLYEFYNIKLK